MCSVQMVDISVSCRHCVYLFRSASSIISLINSRIYLIGSGVRKWEMQNKGAEVAAGKLSKLYRESGECSGRCCVYLKCFVFLLVMPNIHLEFVLAATRTQNEVLTCDIF